HCRNDSAQEQGRGGGGSGQEQHSVSAHELLQPIQLAGWTRENSFLLQVVLYVHCQPVCCCIAAGSVLLQALQDNPVQITSKLRQQPGRFDMSPLGGLGQFLVVQRLEFGRGTQRVPLTYRASQFLHPRFQQVRGVKGGVTRQ